MRLAYLTSVYARASDTFVRAEVLGLRARGHEVATFSIRRPGADQLTSDEVRREHASTTYLLPDHKLGVLLAPLKRLVRSPGRFLRALALSWRTGQPGLRGRTWHLAYLFEACFLAERMEAAGIEHLHVHLEESPATVAMLAAEASGIPFSMAVHGPYVFRAPLQWALGEKIRRSAFTTCITEFTKSQCMIYAPQEAWPKLELVRCAPQKLFLDAGIPPLPREKRLVWVGRVCEEKGVPVLLEAAERLAREGRAFELVLLGDGPLLPAVRASLERRGLASRVRCAGWASSETVRDELARARAMVLPSFAEGLPVVLMEALAMGRPTISTYVAGIPELVEPGACGWLVPAGSVGALAEAMRAALDLPDAELERLGREGRRRVEERHDLARELDVLERRMRGSADRETERPAEARASEVSAG